MCSSCERNRKHSGETFNAQTSESLYHVGTLEELKFFKCYFPESFKNNRIQILVVLFKHIFVVCVCGEKGRKRINFRKILKMHKNSSKLGINNVPLIGSEQ